MDVKPSRTRYRNTTEQSRTPQQKAMSIKKSKEQGDIIAILNQNADMLFCSFLPIVHTKQARDPRCTRPA